MHKIIVYVSMSRGIIIEDKLLQFSVITSDRQRKWEEKATIVVVEFGEK